MPSRRDHRAIYRRRKALAQAQGFKSLHHKRHVLSKAGVSARTREGQVAARLLAKMAGLPMRQYKGPPLPPALSQQRIEAMWAYRSELDPGPGQRYQADLQEFKDRVEAEDEEVAKDYRISYEDLELWAGADDGPDETFFYH